MPLCVVVPLIHLVPGGERTNTWFTILEADESTEDKIYNSGKKKKKRKRNRTKKLFPPPSPRKLRSHTLVIPKTAVPIPKKKWSKVEISIAKYD